MGYNTYWAGEGFTITPQLSEEHAAILRAALEGPPNHSAYPDPSSVPEIEQLRSKLPSLPLELLADNANLETPQMEGRSYASDVTDELRYLAQEWLKPRGYSLSGEMYWTADQDDDRGSIYAKDNQVEMVVDLAPVNPGPSWQRETTAEGLRAKYDGDTWGNHPEHTMAQWRAEVANEDTRIGYWEWVASKIADEPASCECDNTHQQNDTVCRWCWNRGRRHWNDAEVQVTT